MGESSWVEEKGKVLTSGDIAGGGLVGAMGKQTGH